VSWIVEPTQVASETFFFIGVITYTHCLVMYLYYCFLSAGIDRLYLTNFLMFGILVNF